MKSMAASRFKDTCLQMIDEVASTKTSIVITKRGRPVARLVPFDAPARKQGLAGSTLREAGDPFGTDESWDADRS